MWSREQKAPSPSICPTYQLKSHLFYEVFPDSLRPQWFPSLQVPNSFIAWLTLFWNYGVFYTLTTILWMRYFSQIDRKLLEGIVYVLYFFLYLAASSKSYTGWKAPIDCLLASWVSHRTALIIRAHIRHQWGLQRLLPISDVPTHNSTHLGLARGSGSFRAFPTGFFSASSAVTRWNSASTLPCKRMQKLLFLVTKTHGANGNLLEVLPSWRIPESILIILLLYFDKYCCFFGPGRSHFYDE